MADEQVPTAPVSAESIMRDPQFSRGLEDVRTGRPFDSFEDDWEYERGRLFGCIAPLAMALWVGKKLNPKAVALFKAALRKRVIT
jgi:hypothetical protein